MKQSINCLIIVLIYGVMIILTSCQTLYVPQHVITPMHEKKGDLEINVQGLYSISGSVNYAFGDHFMGGLSTNVYSQSDTSSNEDFKMSGATIDLGYYTLDKESNKRFEVMGGFGGGDMTTRADNFKFTRVYVQPSIGFIQKKIESVISLRINGMFYEPAKTNIGSLGAFNARFIEPTYTFRGGGEQLKFHGQFGISLPIGGNLPNNFAYVPFIASVGLSFKLNVLKNKTKPEIMN